MRIIKASTVSDTVARLFVKAAYMPDEKLRAALECAKVCENSERCRAALGSLCENLDAAEHRCSYLSGHGNGCGLCGCWA